MFRIFLRKKLLSGNKDEGVGLAATSHGLKSRNRRMFDRHNVSHQHLTMMNEQDILVIRDISAKGFASDVSERAFERFLTGDVYEARMRYLGESFDLQIRVTWKENRLVGFEINQPSADVLRFLRRLLRPIEIAQSLNEVDAEFMRENKEAKAWFHGDYETELFLWRSEDGKLLAWKLISGSDFVEWKDGEGVTTGSIARPSPGSALEFTSLTNPEEVERRDLIVVKEKQQFATDLIMALNAPVREEIIETMARS